MWWGRKGQEGGGVSRAETGFVLVEPQVSFSGASSIVITFPLVYMKSAFGNHERVHFLNLSVSPSKCLLRACSVTERVRWTSRERKTGSLTQSPGQRGSQRQVKNVLA